MLKLIDIKAFAVAIAVTIVTLVLILVGSRSLQNFDAALVAYLFGTLFAIFGIVYRYTVWIQRPPTKTYFKRSIKALLSKEFLHFSWFSIQEFFKNIVFSKFHNQKRKEKRNCTSYDGYWLHNGFCYYYSAYFWLDSFYIGTRHRFKS